MVFDIKKNDTADQPANITLSTPDKKRFRLEWSPYGEVNSEWKTIRISLSDFSLRPEDLLKINSIGFTAAGTKSEAPPSQKSGELSIKNIRFSDEWTDVKLQLPDYSFVQEKKLKNFKRGHAAWIYNTSDAQVEQIIRYNQQQQQRQSGTPIRILFVYSGSINLSEKTGVFEGFNTDRLKWFREHLPKDIEIYANVDAAHGNLLGQYTWKEQERLGKQLAEAANTNADISGLHFDIEPYTSGALPFYVAVKKFGDKPLSAAVGNWDHRLLEVLDLPVLMAYDQANSPSRFRQSAESLYRSFSADASAAHAFYYLGVPFVATTLEMEYSENRQTGEQKKSGYKMAQFIEASLAAFQANTKIPDDTYWGGVAVWGFIDEKKKGVGAPKAQWGYYPHQLDDERLQYLKSFK